MRTEARPVQGLIARIQHGLDRGGTRWMLAGSLIAGLGAYLFQVVGARSLGEVDYAPISVLWTIQYLLSSVLFTALESWVVRTTTTGHGSLEALRRAAPRLIGVVLGVTVLLTATVYVARDSMLPSYPELVVVVPALVVTYAAFVVVRGVLAARDRYKAYGGVTALESMIRLAAAVVLAVTAPTAALLAWTLPLGALGAAAWGLTSRLWDRTPTARAVQPVPPTPAPTRLTPARFLGMTTGANAAAQVIIASGPLLLGPLGASASQVSIFFVTVTAARVPLVIVQGGVLSRLLPSFTRLADAGHLAQLVVVGSRIAAAAAMLGAVAGLLGFLLGPRAIGLLFGVGFAPSPLVAAGVAGGITVATGALLLNQVLIACRRERAMLLAWWTALTAAGTTVAATPGLPPIPRVLLASLLGELLALSLLVVVLRGPRRRADHRPRQPRATTASPGAL